jgi:hypothetical protein
MKKNRMVAFWARRLKVSRKMFIQRSKFTARRNEQQRLKSLVIEFLKQEKNSTPLPAKREQMKKGGTKYTLNDTLRNLYRRFQEANPTEKISFATFAKNKPNYMKTIQYALRRQCLCVRHRNGVLKLQALNITGSLSVFLDKHTDVDIENIISKLPRETVRFKEWQREEIMSNGNSLKRLQLQQVEMDKHDFSAKCKVEFKELRGHIERVANQYEELTRLRNNLNPLTELTCQLDYAENYNCCHQDEPSAAFYVRKQVTIHPMVIHYKDLEGNLCHKSFVGISEEKSHAAATTLSFLHKLVPQLKSDFPQLKVVHYISDSPVNQYRNKSIVKVVSEHGKIFEGISCTWDYLESGHGKGPCDGVGGAIKKAADIAVKAGMQISNAKEFFEWAEKYSTNMKCLYVTSGEIHSRSRQFNNCVPVKGLSVAHSLRPKENKLWMREKSCYKGCCSDELSCQGWVNTNIPILLQEQGNENEDATQKENPQVEKVPKVGQMVKANYENKVYIGKIVEYDESHSDYYINFMKANKNGKYFWPKRRDEVWVESKNIIEVVTDEF